MITNEAKKEDPKAELQKLANWVVIEALRPEHTCTNEEWDAVLESFNEDCETAGACPVTMLVLTTAELTRDMLSVMQPKPLPAPPPRVLSKLRPAVR